jgi:predicted nucleic acid-binding protein
VKRRFLLDINVVLDVLLDRQPHAEAAAGLWGRVERGEAHGLLPGHALTTIHYLAAKARGGGFAREVLDQLLTIFRVVAVDEKILRRALEMPLRDFEDSVCAACAESATCDAVVARDPRGFRGASVAVINPATAIGWLDATTP